MKLVHEAVIERGEIFEAIGTGFFETFEEEDLCARVYLFQEMAQLSHGVTAGWDTKNIVYKALDELLSEILAGEIALWEFSRGQKLVEGDGLGSKWDRLLLRRGHADDTPDLGWRNVRILFSTLLDHLANVKCAEGAYRLNERPVRFRRLWVKQKGRSP
jgi:hypothetical protein